MRYWLIGAAAVAGTQTAAAQAPFVSKPIDTTNLVVRPADTVAGVTSATTGGTIRTLGRTVAGAIESNGFVRTINNLFGTRATPTQYQPGYSRLPLPSSYLSTKYTSPFKPAVPVASTYGTTPNVAVPTGPTSNR